MGSDCVLWEVETNSLSMMYLNFNRICGYSPAFHRGGRVLSETRQCKICSQQIGAGTDFHSSSSVFPVSIILPVPHNHLYCNKQVNLYVRQACEAWEPNEAVLLRVSVALDRNVLSLCSKSLYYQKFPNFLRNSNVCQKIKKSATDRCFELQPFSMHPPVLPR
jgi:hypothetical protein